VNPAVTSSFGRVCLFLILFSSVQAFAQERTYKKEDIAQGGQLFRANCAVCHGPDGDAVPGIDLGRNQFRRVSTDDEIVKVIRNGVPGTAMPAASMPEFQARFIVAYLRSQAQEAVRFTSNPGDAGRGKALFDGKGGCLACHRVFASGSRIGPDLSDIGLYRRSSELEQSLLEPNAEILPPNRMVQAITNDGKTITGRLLNQDTFSLQMLDSDENLTSFTRSNLRDFKYLEISSMPSYKDKFSPQEMADLLTYMASLKGTSRNGR
jgi:putative heme-binding domain-containing protein